MRTLNKNYASVEQILAQVQAVDCDAFPLHAALLPLIAGYAQGEKAPRRVLNLNAPVSVSLQSIFAGTVAAPSVIASAPTTANAVVTTRRPAGFSAQTN